MRGFLYYIFQHFSQKKIKIILGTHVCVHLIIGYLYLTIQYRYQYDK